MTYKMYDIRQNHLYLKNLYLKGSLIKKYIHKNDYLKLYSV